VFCGETIAPDPDSDSDPDPDLDETLKHMKLHENQEFPLAFQKTRAMPQKICVICVNLWIKTRAVPSRVFVVK